MKIAIAGAGGLLGKALSNHLEKKGYEVTAIARQSDSHGHTQFPQATAQWLEGFDVVINLAGENIAGKRWSTEQKELILTSRTSSTEALVEALNRTSSKPTLFINGSAIGIYGNCKDEVVTEASPDGKGFLPATCKAWEEAAMQVQRSGLRCVIVRTGIVLSRDGGALQKMLLPFQMGAGGTLGDGTQYMSWIAAIDWIRAIEFIIQNQSISGAINLTAPNPVTNQQFTKCLGEILHRPTLIPAPGFGLKLLLGEMAQEMLLEGCRVMPDKLLKAGFEFQFSDLTTALKEEILSPVASA